jgi:hypothetical protein
LKNAVAYFFEGPTPPWNNNCGRKFTKCGITETENISCCSLLGDRNVDSSVAKFFEDHFEKTYHVFEKYFWPEKPEVSVS